MTKANPLPAGDDQVEEHAPAMYAPRRHLSTLLRRSQKRPSKKPSDRRKLSSIDLMPELFQPRNMDPQHISELRRALRNGGDLEPVLVFRAATRATLIDGHHRAQAYREEGKIDIPVIYFEGTPEEAVLMAGRANSRAKLPMTNQERQNFAWRLVLLGEHSKAQISEASGVSDRQVAYMRNLKKELRHLAYGCRSWYEAHRTAKGLNDTRMTSEEMEEWLEQRAEDYARRLSKEFGGKLIRNPQLAARALELHFDARLHNLMRELRDRSPEGGIEEEE